MKRTIILPVETFHDLLERVYAETHRDEYPDEPIECIKDGVIGTRRIDNLCKRIFLLLTGDCSNYMDHDIKVVVDELKSRLAAFNIDRAMIKELTLQDRKAIIKLEVSNV